MTSSNDNKETFTSAIRGFFSRRLTALILLFGVMLSLCVASTGALLLYEVLLKDDLVPNINGPVSRFIANIDFDTRTVNLDATISKTIDADEKIAIWRFGDGKVVKSVGLDEITKNEVTQYQFQKPGSYTVGYSVIDTNDLSDEAFCTIRFAEGPDLSDPKISAETAELLTDEVDEDCGKSMTVYNNKDSVSTLNRSREEIRFALFIFGISLCILLFTVILNRLIVRLFKKTPKV